MAQWLRVLTALGEVQVLSTYMVAHNHLELQFQGALTYLLTLGHQHTCDRHKLMQVHTYTLWVMVTVEGQDSKMFNDLKWLELYCVYCFLCFCFSFEKWCLYTACAILKLTMQTQLASQRSTCLCLLRAGFKGVCHTTPSIYGMYFIIQQHPLGIVVHVYDPCTQEVTLEFQRNLGYIVSLTVIGATW